MARKAALALALARLAVVLVATAIVGCTWAETQREYPPSMRQQPQGQGHAHAH